MTAARATLWSATAAGLALSVRAAWLGAPPLWLALVAFSAYVALILLGVFFPRYGMYADVISRGSPERRELALTFDDGPDPHSTRKVLEILRQRDAKATFFLIGRKVEVHPDVVREIAEAGHGVAVHGFRHDRLFSLRSPAYVQHDIERSQRAIETACGVRPELFRPPIGFVSPRTAEGAKRAGVALIDCSVRGYDGTGRRSARSLLRRIERGLERGAIVLLHDAAENDDFTPAAIEVLPDLLDAIERKGLKPVTLERLLKHA